MFPFLTFSLGLWLSLASAGAGPRPNQDKDASKERSVEDCITALRDSDAKVRSEAAAALGKMGAKAKDAVEALTKALRDPDPSVGVEAASALGRIGKHAVPALIEALKGSEAQVRWGAARDGPLFS